MTISIIAIIVIVACLIYGAVRDHAIKKNVYSPIIRASWYAIEIYKGLERWLKWAEKPESKCDPNDLQVISKMVENFQLNVIEVENSLKALNTSQNFIYFYNAFKNKLYGLVNLTFNLQGKSIAQNSELEQCVNLCYKVMSEVGNFNIGLQKYGKQLNCQYAPIKDYTING